jgi:hypothetical protein
VSEDFRGLSSGAQDLYFWLKEMEHRYSGRNSEEVFFHTDEAMAEEMKTSVSSIQRWRKELTDAGIVRNARLHFVESSTGKRSTKRVMGYVFEKGW